MSSNKRKRTRLLVILVLVLAGVRLALPEIVKWKVNKILGTLEDYEGHVDGVHLGLWRGRVVLKDLALRHCLNTFSLTLQEFDARTDIRSLFKGAWVADLRVASPRVRFLVQRPAQAAKETKKQAKEAQQEVKQKTGKNIPDLLTGLIPFQIREFHLSDGSLRIQEAGQDLQAQQEKDKDQGKNDEDAQKQEKTQEARVTHLDVVVSNLTNRKNLSGSLTATGNASARVMDRGRFRMNLKINPVAKSPTFDVNMALSEINLVELNPLFRWQWGIDVKKGFFAMYMEAAAHAGQFKGYVKPFLHDVEVLDSEQDKKKSLGKKIKEAIADVVSDVLENPDSKNVATKVPFEGKFDDPKVGLWGAVTTVLRNAFIKALSPRLDNSIS